MVEEKNQEIIIYDIHAPWKTLDPWQKKYIETEGNCFLLCSRQSGKTAAMAIKFGRRAALNPKRIIGMFAFTEKQAYNMFFKTLMYLKAEFPKMIKTGKDKPTRHIIQLTNGSIIMCYAVGLTGEGIRTYTLTDLVIDEAAPMAREVFIALTPMLAVTKGTLDISSTPRGKSGYFFECSDHPSLGDKMKKNITRFYVEAKDCPRHTEEFLSEERASMSELEYAQEYLAKFLDEVRQVFSTEWIKKVCMGGRPNRINPDGDYYLGCDVARKDRDEFTFEIFDFSDRESIFQVENIVTKGVPIPDSAKRIISLNEEYDFRKEYIDSGGMGITVCDILRDNDENKRKVVEINNASRRYMENGKEQKKGILKEDLYENLLMLGEQGKLTLLKDKDLMQSIQSVQFEIINGKARYYGNNTHIAEGVIRGVWGSKDKDLKPYIC